MRETIRKAFVDSIPIMAGYVFIGIGFGIIMEDKGMGHLLGKGESGMNLVILLKKQGEILSEATIYF